MNGILQGTTPKLVITIPDTCPLSSVTGVELTMWQEWKVEAAKPPRRSAPVVFDLADVTIDTEANTVTYAFTEAQTLALDPCAELGWQLRLKTASEIVGTLPSLVNVYDLISEVSMT